MLLYYKRLLKKEVYMSACENKEIVHWKKCIAFVRQQQLPKKNVSSLAFMKR